MASNGGRGRLIPDDHDADPTTLRAQPGTSPPHRSHVSTTSNQPDATWRSRAASLRGLDDRFLEPLEVDEGFVAYEWIGADNYLGEPGRRVRGANVTSLDALMRASCNDGTVVLIAIEWKYTESPDPRQKLLSDSGTNRVDVYRPLLERDDCPIHQGPAERLFYELYYQLMRQTLLAWQMVEHAEFDGADWVHLQVVPSGNAAVRGRTGAAPDLEGATSEEAWRSALVVPTRFRQLTQTEFLG
jgi:restriction endonuclease-like protein